VKHKAESLCTEWHIDRISDRIFLPEVRPAVSR